MNCKQMIAYPERTSDGHRCMYCNGHLKIIKKGTKKELKEAHSVDICFSGRRKRQERVCKHTPGKKFRLFHKDC